MVLRAANQNRNDCRRQSYIDSFAPAETQYTEYGKIAEEQLFSLQERFPSLSVDQYVIMPNHIHMILVLTGANENVSHPKITDVVCTYKSLTTRACKKLRPIEKLFQPSFYEHVIRGQADYDEIAAYIQNNPKQWELDKLYTRG